MFLIRRSSGWLALPDVDQANAHNFCHKSRHKRTRLPPGWSKKVHMLSIFYRKYISILFLSFVLQT